MSVNTESEIKTIIADISGYDEGEIAPEKNFYEDLGIDSIKAIEVTVAIEKKFKVNVRDEEIPKITTVRQAVQLVEKLLAAKGAVNANASA